MPSRAIAAAVIEACRRDRFTKIAEANTDLFGEPDSKLELVEYSPPQ